jgi:hypothetical protein
VTTDHARGGPQQKGDDDDELGNDEESDSPRRKKAHVLSSANQRIASLYSQLSAEEKAEWANRDDEPEELNDPSADSNRPALHGKTRRAKCVKSLDSIVKTVFFLLIREFDMDLNSCVRSYLSAHWPARPEAWIWLCLGGFQVQKGAPCSLQGRVFGCLPI